MLSIDCKSLHADRTRVIACILMGLAEKLDIEVNCKLKLNCISNKLLRELLYVCDRDNEKIRYVEDKKNSISIMCGANSNIDIGCKYEDEIKIRKLLDNIRDCRGFQKINIHICKCNKASIEEIQKQLGNRYCLLEVYSSLIDGKNRIYGLKYDKFSICLYKDKVYLFDIGFCNKHEVEEVKNLIFNCCIRCECLGSEIY